MIGIYIHVPFCAGEKCPYCDFFSEAFDEYLQEKYIANLLGEIKTYPAKIGANTLYFGGGTPSLIDVGALSRIQSALSERFDLRLEEFTVECNPNTVTAEKLCAYRDLGVSRLSFGVQSLNCAELSALGRKHSPQQAIDSVRSAQAAGFENISVDIMLGVPSQTLASLSETLEKIAALNVRHVSAYILKIEEKTPFFLQGVTVDDDNCAELYLFAVEKLRELGFLQYEISNFCESGYECRHNLKYWRAEEYIGLGVSAHSFFGGERYYNALQNGVSTEIVAETNPNRREEEILLGLRLAEGVEFDVPTIEKNRALEKSGFIIVKNNNVSLTPKGFLVSNQIISKFL